MEYKDYTFPTKLNVKKLQRFLEIFKEDEEIPTECLYWYDSEMTKEELNRCAKVVKELGL